MNHSNDHSDNLCANQNHNKQKHSEEHTVIDEATDNKETQNNQINNNNKNKKRKKQATQKWKMLYANIRGVKGKRSSLIEHLHAEKPEICLLTETLLQSDNALNISGYTFFGKARTDRKGGGVGILVQNEIRNKIIPHTSDRSIEITWISVQRQNMVPLFIGCYYGKQESRCSKDEIQNEMNLLSEEIEEFQKEGEVMMFMDGNGKLGLLGEQKSRNGLLLETVFEEHNLSVINKSEKCIGCVTRQDKQGETKSAIDFVVVEETLEKNIEKMIIDEAGLVRMKGSKDSDHNTIIVTFNLEGQENCRPETLTKWRLNAPKEIPP